MHLSAQRVPETQELPTSFLVGRWVQINPELQWVPSSIQPPWHVFSSAPVAYNPREKPAALDFRLRESWLEEARASWSWRFLAKKP